MRFEIIMITGLANRILVFEVFVCVGGGGGVCVYDMLFYLTKLRLMNVASSTMCCASAFYTVNFHGLRLFDHAPHS